MRVDPLDGASGKECEVDGERCEKDEPCRGDRVASPASGAPMRETRPATTYPWPEEDDDEMAPKPNGGGADGSHAPGK